VRKRGFAPVLLLVLVAISLVGGLLYLKTQNFKLPNSIDLSTPTPRPLSDLSEKELRDGGYLSATPDATITRVDNACTSEQCLFLQHGVYEGLATVQGYYHQYQKEDWGGEKVTCDAIVVTEGSKVFVDHFKANAEGGNSINSISKEGYLILNLDLGDLYNTSQLDIQRIKASSSTNPVTLKVINETRIDTGVPACYSFVDILNVI
jgi:hypothetical protein